MSAAPRYNEVARILHWLIAGLIVLQYVLASLAEEASSDLQELALLANHKSVGMTVLLLAVVRIIWRLTHAAPELPSSVRRWQVLASTASHVLLYFLIFALPISGWLFSSASAFSVSWFNVFVFPDLVSGNEDLAETLEEVHEFMAKALFVLALVHIAAALKHGILDRDGVLGRMSSWLSIGLFAAAVAAGISTLIVPAPVAVQTPEEQPAHQVDVQAPAEPILVDTSLPLWTIDSSQSHIRFTADQAGAPFTGNWERWSAEIRFDPDDLAASSAGVSIDATSPSTGDSERDSTLAKSEWFDSGVHPEVVFQTNAITAVGSGSYLATGTLRIRNGEHPVQLTFTHTREGDNHVINGQVELDRLALGLGTGEWSDTSWVGQQVKVEIRVVGIPAA